MPQHPVTVRSAGPAPAAQAGSQDPAGRNWQPPRYRVIPLDCEITAYAPDDEPLF